MKKIISILLLAASAISANAQVNANRADLKKIDGDSNSNAVRTEYPYMLPILGKKVAKAGFDLPYSAGIGINYLYQKSDIVISDLSAGFNNGSMYPLDNIIKFNSATVTSQGVNIRPDVWVLPFLNVYGIFAKSYSTTSIDAAINLPNPSVPESKISIPIKTEAKFEGTTAGFGLTPSMAVRGIWMAMDMNFTWTDIPALEKPAFIYVFGPRFGKTFKLHKPERALAFWAGGFRVQMSSTTTGSLPIGDLFNTDGWNQNIDNAYAKIDESRQSNEDWWANEADQSSHRDQAQYAANNAKIDAAEGLTDRAAGTVNNVENASVQYSLSKRPADKWNFIVGSQYQFNKHWMVRCEVGFLSARTQVLTGLQYRFGL